MIEHSKEWYDQKAALEEGQSVEAGPGQIPTLAEIRLLIWSEALRNSGPNEQKFVSLCEMYARRWSFLNRTQNQHLRTLKLSDICQCGLYRSQHENYSGKGKDACQQFRFQREASAEDEKHWKQYHEPRKERRQPDDSL